MSRLPRARRLPALASVLVSLLLVPALSSCGGDGGSDDATTDPASETVTEATESDDADATEDVAADDASDEVPEGGEGVEAAGVAFDVPEGWRSSTPRTSRRARTTTR